MGFFDNVLKDIDEDQVRLAKDLDDSEFFIDTGSYIFNALCSKSIFGGVSANKVTAIAGETSTGKTIFALALKIYDAELLGFISNDLLLSDIAP